ncbi:M48 metallopeptidase family protein [Pseudoalteromonas sp. T1lg65]|uniref:M48 metallopeptidase family protein n=1 Tax=Pseudoalteromonas sp. T1lg65 TaxID=2077101 RepID=UPI003F7A1826
MSHPYFSQYSAQVQQQVEQLIKAKKLAEYFFKKYPKPHLIRNEKQLYQYVETLRQRYLKNAAKVTLAKYEKRKNLVLNALGTHTFKTTKHGKKLKTSHQIHISDELKTAPEAMLHVLVVHELAHFKEKDHNKAFYQLCTHMEPHYHQLELELRLFMVMCELEGNIYA